MLGWVRNNLCVFLMVIRCLLFGIWLISVFMKVVLLLLVVLDIMMFLWYIIVCWKNLVYLCEWCSFSSLWFCLLMLLLVFRIWLKKLFLWYCVSDLVCLDGRWMVIDILLVLYVGGIMNCVCWLVGNVSEIIGLVLVMCWLVLFLFIIVV